MTVLVTGGAGYIGSHMVLRLLDQGERVVVIDNLSSGFREAVPPEATLVIGDAGDHEFVCSVMQAHQVNALVHFAARIVVPESVADPLGYYAANTMKTRALIAAAVTCGVRHVIFSSTAAVYGNPATSPVSEEAQTVPMSPYGASKLMSEWMLRDTAVAHDLRYVALRYFNVAGADPRGRAGQSTPNATHLIKVAVQTALGIRSAIQVFGTDYLTSDGTCIRDYIHVSDLIAAHAAALVHLRAGGPSGVFNCGYGRGYSVLEVIEAVRRVAGVNIRAEFGPRRPGDPASIVAEARRIRAELGWRPELDDLDTIVEHALRWERHLQQRS